MWLCIRTPKQKGGRGVPEAVTNIVLEIMENCQTEGSNGQTSAKVSGINLAKFRAWATLFLRMPEGKRTKHVFMETAILQLCYINISKTLLRFSRNLWWKPCFCRLRCYMMLRQGFPAGQQTCWRMTPTLWEWLLVLVVSLLGARSTSWPQRRANCTKRLTTTTRRTLPISPMRRGECFASHNLQCSGNCIHGTHFARQKRDSTGTSDLKSFYFVLILKIAPKLWVVRFFKMFDKESVFWMPLCYGTENIPLIYWTKMNNEQKYNYNAHPVAVSLPSELKALPWRSRIYRVILLTTTW